jgi:nucleoside-specific outer membrane channel protein Tsx
MGFLATAQAANWSSTSVLIHSGQDYELTTKPDYTLISLEHVSGWDYGQNFFFVDVTRPASRTSEFYSEFSPSLSLKSLSGYNLPGTLNWNLAATIEMGQNTSAQLYGLSFDLAMPGTRVFNVALYQRQSQSNFVPGKTGSAPQVTLVWNAPFQVGTTHWVFEGFLDYAMAETEIDKSANLVTQPRLWFDLGANWQKPGQLAIGLEYSIWRNKYGVKNVNENVPQLSAKWTF